jgi:hypothetical protein
MNALFGGWVDILGGRQSARTLHFAAAFCLLAFVVVHVFEVIVTGLWNNLRSMITGYYRVPETTRTRRARAMSRAPCRWREGASFRLAVGAVLPGALAGCDRLAASDSFNGMLRSAQFLSRRAQALLTGR